MKTGSLQGKPGLNPSWEFIKKKEKHDDMVNPKAFGLKGKFLLNK